MILLLGASGYIGQTFCAEFRRRGWDYLCPCRHQFDLCRFDVLVDLLRRTKPEFVVNAAGYVGKPNVDACETARAEALTANTLLPLTIAHACLATDTPWGHVSSGCLFSGAVILQHGKRWVERDLNQADVRALVQRSPDSVQGFTEEDEPNFSFRSPPCSFYSGSKALAEEMIAGLGQCYIWRIRIPFDQFDNARNYLSKLQRYPRLYDNFNSLSHRGDCVRACLDLWEHQAPFGIYNVTNPGFITTKLVVAMIQDILQPKRRFEFWENDEEFYRVAAKAPRSNCVLNVSKLLSIPVPLRPVVEALESCLHQWEPEGI